MSRRSYQVVPGWGRRPAHWRVCRIRDVLLPSKDGFTVKDNVEYTQVTVRIRHRGIVPRGQEVGVRIKTKKQNQIRSGQFLISKIDARNGACGIVPPELAGAITTHDFLAYDVAPKLATPEFWDILSGTSQFVELCKLASEGTTNRVRLRPDEFMALLVPLPPLPDQRRIADALRVMDDAIRANEEVLEHTRALKKSLAHELLTRGIPGRHKRFKDSPLGKIPAEWEVKRLGEVAEVENGTTPSKKNPDYWHAGAIPWLSSSKINDRIIRSSDQFITDVALRECSLSLLPRGTVVVAMIGQGKTRGMVAMLDMQATINQNLAAIRMLPGLDPWFLFHQLDASYQILRDTGRGSNQGALNCRILKNFRILIPIEAEQIDIAEAIASADVLIDDKEKMLRHADCVKNKLRDALLAGALGGAA